MQASSDFWSRYIHLTGLIHHSLYWPFAPNQDQRYPNPHFKKFPTKDVRVFSGKIAIYCLHGIGDSSASFRWFTERAIAQLHPCISSINIIPLNNLMTTYEEDARCLVSKIRANNDEDVILIGHSKGAMNSACAAEKFTKNAGINVHAVMAITAPFNGSNLALWPITAISPPIKQMELGSPDSRELVELIQRSPIPYYYYATGRDGFLETESCIVRGNCSQFHIYAEHGHTSIMGSLALSQDLIADLFDACTNLVKIYCPLDELPKLKFEPGTIEERKLLIACSDIEAEIIKIRTRRHIKSAVNKIYLLARLKFLLSELLDPNIPNPYPASNIYKFVMLFLNDKNVMYGEKPLDILKDQLNWSLHFIGGTKPKSLKFLETFLKLHGKTLLPERHKPTHDAISRHKF